MKRTALYVILLCWSLKSFSQQENAFPLKGSIWHTHVISVCWDNPTAANQKMREAVKDAITNSWQKNSALQFTDWCPASEKDADIHIYINDEGPHTTGLGTTIKNTPHGMILNFTFENWSPTCKNEKEFCIRAIAIHEFGHAIGFAHEQNRPDCHFPNCLGQEQGGNGDWYITQCDSNSIMNYCSPQWNNNGTLSLLDIQAVQSLYDGPPQQAIVKPALQIVQNAEYVDRRRGMNRYNFKIYVAAEDKELNRIDHVTYNLSDAEGTFKNENMVAGNRYSNFGIGLLKVYGEFDIKVTIDYKGGSKKEVTHHLTIDKGVQKSPVKQKGNL